MRGLSLVLFFTSGASALAYQAIWGRMLGLVFGNTVFASSTVLSVFMAGLALGGALGGSRFMRRRAGLRLYAALEAAAALAGGVLVPLLAPRLPALYAGLARGVGFGGLTALRFALSFLLLIVPCTAMGATLPVIVGALGDRQATPRSGGAGVAMLYGVNTLGSVAGCCLAGFVLVGSIGLLATSLAAAGVQAAVAVVAVAASRRRAGTAASHPAGPPAPAARRLPWTGHLVAAAYGASGFAALALEVGWTRALVWTIGLDTYAFTAMLAVVLAGIGIGSLAAAPLARRGRAGTLVPWSQALVGCSVFLSIAAVRASPDALRGLVDAVNSSTGLRVVFTRLGAYAMIQLAIAAFVMLVPAVLMGASFPLFVARLSELSGGEASGTGRAYAANTAGGILGAAAMGFVLVPGLGLLTAIAAMGGVYFLVAITLAAAPVSGHDRRFGPSRWVALAAVPAAAAVLLATVRTDFGDVLAKTLRVDGRGSPLETILYYRDTATGAVFVKESPDNGREMLIDGTQVASTGSFDLHSHLYPAHLIGLLHPSARDVLVVAFGCGGTCGSLLLYDEVKRVEAVEICEGVLDPARRWFSEMNRGVIDDPRLQLFIQDGKNFVRLTDRRYDVVYSGPIHPQSNQGSAALYTLEYFEDCSRLLKPGGFQVLWLPMHVTDPAYFATIVRTFLSVYPHVSLWYLPQTDTAVSHPHLVGSFEEIPLDYGRIAERLARPGIREDLARIGDASFSRPAEFISQRAMGTAALRDLVSGGTALNTDDLPVVEYYRPALDLRASSKRSKAILISQVLKRLEDPLPSVAGVPAGARAALESEVARYREADTLLLEGHALVALAEASGDPELAASLGPRVLAAYREARRLAPERDFVSRFLAEGAER